MAPRRPRAKAEEIGTKKQLSIASCLRPRFPHLAEPVAVSPPLEQRVSASPEVPAPSPQAAPAPGPAPTQGPRPAPWRRGALRDPAPAQAPVPAPENDDEAGELFGDEDGEEEEEDPAIQEPQLKKRCTAAKSSAKASQASWLVAEKSLYNPFHYRCGKTAGLKKHWAELQQHASEEEQ